MGEEQNTSNFRGVDTEVKRGKKENNPSSTVLESGVGTKNQAGLSAGPTKHSLPIDQDPTKSKKSTGEPETAKASGTVGLRK